jgi:F0F1-type ATP synthase delta subunit
MMITPSSYAKALYAVTSKLSEVDAKKLIGRFVEMMEARGLGALLKDVLKAMPEVADAHEGIFPVKITSATKLTEGLIAEILDAMEIPEKKANIHTVVDPEIGTGFRAESPTSRLSHSLDERLASLKQIFISH